MRCSDMHINLAHVLGAAVLLTLITATPATSQLAPARQQVPASQLAPADQQAPENQRTIYAAALPDLPENHSPGGALWRGFIPGFGQVYNRQFYKLPFVYGGLAGLAYGFFHYNGEYLLFRRAGLFRQCQEGAPNCEPEWREFEDAYRQIQRFPDQQIASTTLHTFRDNARRSRDLFFVGVTLYYALTVLDAYVSAHLVHFDVSESLSLRLVPAQRGFAAALRF